MSRIVVCRVRVSGAGEMVWVGGVGGRAQCHGCGVDWKCHSL